MIRGNSYFLRRLLFLTFLSFSFFSIVRGQETNVILKAPEVVEVGEQFRLSYTVESNQEVKDPVIIKNINGFKIVYGPTLSTSSSISFVKGKRIQSYSATSTYVLEAQRKGEYILPKGEVTIDGKKYRSESAKIKVSSTETVSTDNIDAFIKVEVSRSSVNLSDTLTLTYRLYTTKDPSRIKDANFPYISNFYSSNITRSRQAFAEEKLKGKVYKVIDLRKLLLQPRSIGVITIPEGEITLEYSSPTGRQVRDIWGDVYEEAVTSEKTLKIESVVIRVQDLKEI